MQTNRVVKSIVKQAQESGEEFENEEQRKEYFQMKTAYIQQQMIQLN
jgi:hypothetical protein